MTNTSTDNSDENKHEKLTTLYWLFSIVFVLWVISSIVIHLQFKTWSNSGAFGDTFGAINSLFSGLAFAGIIFTIILQKRELALQRQELKFTRQELSRTAEAQEKSEKALGKQAKSLENSAKLNAMNTIVMYYNQRMEMTDVSWDERTKANNTSIEYIAEIQKIIEKIDNERD